MDGGVIEDDVGNFVPAPGTVTALVPCLYRDIGRLARSDAGTVAVQVPTLSLPAASGIVEGDEIRDVTDQLGNVIEVGPLHVEQRLDSSLAFGSTMLARYELRVGTP